MTECTNCGAFVSRDFVRVFGSNGDAHACPNCASTARLVRGEAASSES